MLSGQGISKRSKSRIPPLSKQNIKEEEGRGGTSFCAYNLPPFDVIRCVLLLFVKDFKEAALQFVRSGDKRAME